MLSLFFLQRGLRFRVLGPKARVFAHLSLSTRKLGPPQAPIFKFDNKEKVLVTPQVVRLIIQE